ncbi:MAG TPA: 3-deoxy-7-phosphoheptulonate synthase, partial [Candidatus Acidoferrales bacterium]
IAGPCAIESREQAFAIAARVQAAGARLFRGGAYKPRTSPYSFQGLGEQGLKILADVRAEFGLKIVTEAVDAESLELVERYADVIQIGARNMQNFSLLKCAGRARKPVLLKRGLSATLDEFLMAAEYLLAEGNPQVILCERGVRTFADHTRNTLDLSVVPAVERLSHLPILVDPSHGTGRRDKVLPLSRAAVAVGADGLLVEVHHQPSKALSDGYQSILPDELDQLMEEVRAEFGLKIVTEAVDAESLDLVEQYGDVIQIGARNMQNFSLLKRAGRARKPVLLKRGLSATLDEFLMAAEYILAEGNPQVILCERGVRTFADHTRNTLDLSVVPAVERLSHLPILVDPSHGTGRRDKVLPLSRAAVAVGADGLLVEVHHQPSKALSDGYQSILPDELDQLMEEVRAIAAVLGRRLAAQPTAAPAAKAL